MRIHFGDDPVRAELSRVIADLDGGVSRGGWETERVDLKEEAGRRDRTGALGPGTATNEIAAQHLAEEAACMANTPGGGALLVGVADDGALVGAALDREWLRHRLYELTQRQLTVDVEQLFVRGVRLLAVVVPTAIEPIRTKGKIHWRVGDHCVEVDAATWHARRMATLNYDWSAEESTVPAAQARPQALAVARDFLRERGDESSRELAAASDAQLLRRLNAVTGQGNLTNAGVLTFVGRGAASVDYVRRAHAGGDSTARVRRTDRSVLEELVEVFTVIDAHNATRHLQTGLTVGQIREIPRLAAREGVVNGIAHREWGQAEPTVVEHVGRTLRVTSPGGFFGGVNEDNIITHPSQSRNRALTQLLADLGVAEREGIGVDRMVREMVRLGHQPPDIREITGPIVRASLVGDTLDEGWMLWLNSVRPVEESQDINSLLLLRRLLTTGWVDTTRAAPLIQLTVDEARGAIAKLSRAVVTTTPLLRSVSGVPAGTEPVWTLHPDAVEVLRGRDRDVGQARALPTRAEVARGYARARGRISTTELGSMVGASASNVGIVLKDLEAEGLLEPSSTARRGRGFFYRWSGGVREH
ncbi:MAG: ATP-binding protein [Dermatophilaceae bacterium]